MIVGAHSAPGRAPRFERPLVQHSLQSQVLAPTRERLESAEVRLPAAERSHRVVNVTDSDFAKRAKHAIPALPAQHVHPDRIGARMRGLPDLARERHAGGTGLAHSERNTLRVEHAGVHTIGASVERARDARRMRDEHRRAFGDGRRAIERILRALILSRRRRGVPLPLALFRRSCPTGPPPEDRLGPTPTSLPRKRPAPNSRA